MNRAAAPISPFKEDNDFEATDRQLVKDALAGSQDALETLARRHQPWVYNLHFAS